MQYHPFNQNDVARLFGQVNGAFERPRVDRQRGGHGRSCRRCGCGYRRR